MSPFGSRGGSQRARIRTLRDEPGLQKPIEWWDLVLLAVVIVGVLGAGIFWRY